MGLIEDVCSQILNQISKTISKFINLSIIVIKTLSIRRDSHLICNKRDKNFNKEKYHKDQNGNGNKKEKSDYRGSNQLYIEEMEKYQK